MFSPVFSLTIAALAMAASGVFALPTMVDTPASPPVAASEPRLTRIVGNWVVTYSTFPGSQGARFVATPAGEGRAVYSVWTQGDGDARYEANALWGYDPATREVRVFEVNTLGIAELHIGAFNDADELIVELREPKGDTVLQRRRFRWSGDKLYMTAWFYSRGERTEHSITLARQR